MTNAARRALCYLAAAELLAMSLWFSGTAVSPQLAQAWHAGIGVTAWLTVAVQLGFVAGALLSAVGNLPDIMSPKRLLVTCAVLAALANAGFAWFAAAASHGGESRKSAITAALFCRLLTGALLAGVYPTGMKLIATWFQQGRGLALGILIAALTVGSALPHALNASPRLPWEQVVLAASALALLGAIIASLAVEEGPFKTERARFEFARAADSFRNRRLLLANLGYLGHMWELYAFWGWIAVLLIAASGRTRSEVELYAFLAIAIGAVGCVWAGRAADRLTTRNPIAQRSRVTIIAMAASAACCILAALVFQHLYMLLVVTLVWGIAVIADSAQFSAIISEVAEPHYVGTALTMQTALGFALTAVSIRVIAWIAPQHGWRWATAAMAIGPLLGIVAMRKLQQVESSSDAVRVPARGSAD